VTTYAETRAGFVALALERNNRATPFVDEARALKAAVSGVREPQELNDIPSIHPALVTAAGVSDKAAGHMLEEDRNDAIGNLIEKFLKPAGTRFVEELIFRFLLTKGDTLGGSMRNIWGALAKQKLARAIIASLTLEKVKFKWTSGKKEEWRDNSHDVAGIVSQLHGISWRRHGENRSILFDIRVPFVGNNVDVCLFNCGYRDISSNVVNDPSHYIILGELKGGIDPAGADEHWKTAGTAIGRIRSSFAKHGGSPFLFYVGAAIEKRMAEEIWTQLRDGTLSNAAKLSDENQVASLCRWLCHA